jgi:2-C-methyl-D-erythritol 4-phosphate cytidylyltransferase
MMAKMAKRLGVTSLRYLSVDDLPTCTGIDRRGLWCAQTPQVFRRSLILEAYEAAERDALEVTDDAQLVERLGHPVAIVPGSDLNIKITTPEDLSLAQAMLSAGLVPAGDWEETR